MDHEGGAFKVKWPDWARVSVAMQKNHAVKIDIVTKNRSRNKLFAANVCILLGYEMGTNAAVQ